MNLIKKINFAILITVMALFLLMPCCFANDTDNNTLIPKTKIEKKTETNHVLSLFFKSTKFVIISIIIILAALLLYKRLNSNNTDSIYYDNIEKDLNSPETIDDAIKFVIEKF